MIHLALVNESYLKTRYRFFFIVWRTITCSGFEAMLYIYIYIHMTYRTQLLALTYH